MSLWRILFGGGARDLVTAATDTVRAVRGDRAAQDAQALEARRATLDQFGAEFSTGPNRTAFDSLVDGLNRLPRPVIAFAVLGLFAFAMVDPVAFAARMQAVALIPEPLWWIMGTVVAFYFAAREAYHFRASRAPAPAEVRATVDAIREIEAIRPDARADPPDQGAAGNPALEEARRLGLVGAGQ